MFRTFEELKDNVCDCLFPHKNNLIIRNVFGSHHVHYRSNYTSITNLPKTKVPCGSNSTDDFSSESSSRSTRQNTDLFDIRAQCFLCSKIKNIKVKGSWVREKLTPISSGDNLSIP